MKSNKLNNNNLKKDSIEQNDPQVRLIPYINSFILKMEKILDLEIMHLHMG